MSGDNVPQRLGKYELIEQAGRGGYAAVYRARDTETGREVALKVLHGGLAGEQALTDRFCQEAETAAGLDHPNIISVYDFGEIQGTLYLAMPLVGAGRTLRDLLRERAPLSLSEALPLLEQIAEALVYLQTHDPPLVHRDVKPANVLLEGDAEHPTAVLTDFGLVRSMEASAQITRSGATLGTPRYMAPEQADPVKWGPVTPLTDVYALGVLAYEMLTGEAPFAGETPLAVLRAHADDPPSSPLAHVPDLGKGLARVLGRALAKPPAKRYPDARALVDALRQAGTPAPPPLWVWVIAGVLAVALLLGGGVWLGRQFPVAERVPTDTSTAGPVTATVDAPTATSTRELTATYTREPTATLTRKLTPTPTATWTPPTPTQTPASSPSALLGTLILQAPEGIALQDTRIYDGTTGKYLELVEGNGPFWLSAGTYTVTLSTPFVGISTGNVRMQGGQETIVDISLGTGKLSLQTPEGVPLVRTTIREGVTGSHLGSVDGSGPFWLPTGVYTVTLAEPFVGVSLGGVTVREGEETAVDTSQGTGTLSLQAPAGISLNRVSVRDAATGKHLSSVDGSGPFWLPTGVYTITLEEPFVGVSHGGVAVQAGEETAVDTGRGTGTLSLRAPAGVSTLNRVSVYDAVTGRHLSLVDGSGPFWLPTGVYTITLAEPFVGVSHGNVAVQAGEETAVDVGQGLGTLALQAPQGVTLNRTSVRDATTGRHLSSVNGNGPFWLPMGVYTVTLTKPFVGVSHGDVSVQTGEETSVDVARGAGTLFLQAPADVALKLTSVQETTTGRNLGTIDGSGPFWLPTGSYTVTLRAPFVGVSHGGVAIQAGGETSVDATRGTGILSLQAPAGIALELTSVQETTTGRNLGTIDGSGPFWLPTGVYTVTLREPFVGVSHGDVALQAGEETSLDVARGTGTLSLQAPEGVALKLTSVRDAATGKHLSSVDGSGPFWLSTGTYTVTLRAPFVGVSHGDVAVQAGEETSLDVTRGTGTLSLQAPAGVALKSSSIYDAATGLHLGAVDGSGPFWLPTGTYTVALSAPFPGVEIGNVTIERDKEEMIDLRS